MENIVNDEVTGTRMEVVDPDSEDDLLLTDEARVARAAASGAAAAPAPTATEVASPQAAPPTTGTPPAAPAPTAPPPAESAVGEGAQDEEYVAALGRLDNYLEERDKEHHEALRSRDQAITRLQQEHTAAIKSIREELRQTQLVGLEEDEKKALVKKWSDDDRTAELDAYAETLKGYDHDLMVVRLTTGYGQYGVKEEDLQDKTLDEMELYCRDSKADYFEKMAKGGIHAAAPQTPLGNVAAPAPAQSAPSTPAGLTAPSDVGSGTPAPKEHEFNPKQGRDAMHENLNNLPVETIQARKA